VNTPTKLSGLGAGSAADLKWIERATRTIAEVAQSSKIVVEKSTVPCKTAESMRTILESNSRAGIKFQILSNPEFLAEGTAVKDLENPDRVLIGSLQTEEGLAAQKVLVDLYANWVPRNRIITMNLWSSELSKLVRSSFLFLFLLLINSLIIIASRLPMPCSPSAFPASTPSAPSARPLGLTSTRSPTPSVLTRGLVPSS